MYLLKMTSICKVMLIAAMALLVAACGSDGTVDTSTAAVADTATAESSSEVEDHADEEHADDDHADEEHSDEDHADEDHDDHADEEHADEEHSDEEHADEDHEEHADEDHDDHGHEEESGSLGAHVHGEAALSVAWSGSDVVVDLISPTENIFGFEYEPSTDDDIALATERTQALTAPGALVFNPEAECDLAGEPTADVVYEGSHAEITASWLFTCESPDEIASLDTATLFEEFPGMIDIDAQWASETDQSAAELSASSAVLRFG